jgi:large repetitive protein
VDRGSVYVFTADPSPVVTLTPSIVPTATAGRSFTTAVAASGGTTPYNYYLSSGTVPPGLTFVPTTGRLYGTPTLAGTFTFTITATDANLCIGSHEFALVVDCPTIGVNPFDPSLPSGALGTAYAKTFTGRGGTAPHVYSLGLGALPAGLTLDPTTGVLSGTPTVAGTFDFSVRATDANGCGGERRYRIIVN